MAAILGRVALDGKPLNKEVFRRAFHVLRPACCSRSDFSIDGSAGYGHHDSGLGIGSVQPITSGDLTLLADVRLYERDDLARSLGLVAQETLDISLILQAYRRWGVGCFSYLNGDFGLAIHDRRKGEVLLARDHIGARPLYWTMRSGEVLFATFLDGLVGFDDIEWPLSERRIARYLCAPHDMRAESFLEGVEIVPPGHWVKVNAERAVRNRWWVPALVPKRQEINAKEAHEELIHLTERAVRARLPTSAPVGSHFSGGIDSTIVSILAAKDLAAQGSRLAAAYAWSPALHEVYPDMGAGDERRVIAEQCRLLGVPVRYGSASSATIETLVSQPMELQGTADLADELPTIEQARNDGIGVMLSGWGGDEGFSSHGYGYLSWLMRKAHMRRVFQVARRNGLKMTRPRHAAAFLWRNGIVPMLPDVLYRQFQPFVDLYGLGAFPSADMIKLNEEFEKVSPTRLVADADAFTQSVFLNGHLGERMATWAAWAAFAGFEYRYPLTDRNLLEFILSLPQPIRFGDGSGRYLARRAFSELLPKGLRKNDLVNEKCRQDNRVEWLRGLKADVRQGRFEEKCPWLDMSALTGAILQASPKNEFDCVRICAPVFVAVRIYEMYMRHTRHSCRAR